MKNNNIIVRFIVYCIRRFWQGKFGRNYNKMNNIMCRFHPSCSEYSILAFERYGVLKGVQLSINRIKRCNPNNTESCIDFP